MEPEVIVGEEVVVEPVVEAPAEAPVEEIVPAEMEEGGILIV